MACCVSRPYLGDCYKCLFQTKQPTVNRIFRSSSIRLLTSCPFSLMKNFSLSSRKVKESRSSHLQVSCCGKTWSIFIMKGYIKAQTDLEVGCEVTDSVVDHHDAGLGQEGGGPGQQTGYHHRAHPQPHPALHTTLHWPLSGG